MKLVVAAENLIERVVLALGLAPVTLVDTHVAFMRARAIMVGVKLGIFDAIADGARTVPEVSARCETHPVATEKLMNALVGAGYLHVNPTGYDLARVARKWVLSNSPHSLRDKLLFEFVEWDLISHVEDFVRTGHPLDMHRSVDRDHWALYQNAMRALAGLGAPEVVSRTPVPTGATRMLDIGGSHGFYSVSLCRRYPELTSVILDLPSAVQQAAPILAKEGMGDRVTHRPGDALVDDLGGEAWDIVFIAQLVHHFDETTNRSLMRRVARALKPGGVLAILELIRPSSPNGAGQVGALLDMYFALTSQSGTWSPQEMAAWQREAGLIPQKPIFFRTMPGAAEIVAIKPPARA